MAQLDKHLTHGLSSCCDLRVMRLSPMSDSTLSSVCFSFSLLLPLPIPLMLSLSNNKSFFKKSLPLASDFQVHLGQRVPASHGKAHPCPLCSVLSIRNPVGKLSASLISKTYAPSFLQHPQAPVHQATSEKSNGKLLTFSSRVEAMMRYVLFFLI